jgi:hypothetical protein
MKDQNVEILLQTPLLMIAPREELRARPVLESIFRVSGKILEENASGVLLSVKSVGSEKAVDKNPPFSQVFIPFHKIDHIIFV